MRGESGAGKPGILGGLRWPLHTLEPSVAPVLALWTLVEGPRNAASELVLWTEGGRNRTAPGFQAQILQLGPRRCL